MDLVLYSLKYKSLLLDYMSEADLKRYTNQGKYSVLSLLGIYHSDLYLCLNGNKVVGCICVRNKLSKRCKREFWIYDVLILPEYRGQGYSKEMMKLAIEKCKGTYVSLYVYCDNKVALGLYKKIGFKEEGQKNEMILMRYSKV